MLKINTNEEEERALAWVRLQSPAVRPGATHLTVPDQLPQDPAPAASELMDWTQETRWASHGRQERTLFPYYSIWSTVSPL